MIGFKSSKHPLFLVGVQCVVLHKSSVLLGRRINTSNEGTWSLPGGHVEMGESGYAAASRELFEETGVISLRCRTLPPFITYDTTTPYVHIPVIIDRFKGKPVEQKDEKLAEVTFFPLHRLPEPLFGPSAEVLKRLQRSHGTHFHSSLSQN